jgi:uncharacterized DUF497 family protein
MDEDYRWNEDKNEQLLRERGLSFEMVVEAINSGGLLNDGLHPDTVRYPHQRMYVVMVNGYVCMVPYVTDGDTAFLKTIFRNRKVNKFYVGEI